MTRSIPYSLADQSDQSVKSLFNRIAPLYDRFNDQFSLGFHQVWKLMAVKWMDPQPNGCYLDLCCGTGDIAFLIAERIGNKGQIYGVDFAEELLTIASQRSELIDPSPVIIWQQGDALDLGFPDESFDGITVGYGFRNWSNFSQGLKELKRVLKSGKKAALLDFHRPYPIFLQDFQRWFLREQVVPAAEKLGMAEEYAYILPSLDRFPQGTEQIKLARKVGFTAATHYPLVSGMMGVLVVQK